MVRWPLRHQIRKLPPHLETIIDLRRNSAAPCAVATIDDLGTAEILADYAGTAPRLP
jgi:hypothetical protein